MDETARSMVAQVWAAGDYAQVARRLEPAADALAGRLGDGAGRRALDVAAGTGSVARRLAARGWSTTASDICAPLLRQGEELAVAEGVAVAWEEAAFDELPFPDEGFAAATSSFGLIFAPDPGAALSEVARCLQPGGVLALTAWTRTGYMAEMTRTIAACLPAGPASTAFDWGDPAWVVAALADGFEDVATESRTLPWHFPDIESTLDFYFDHSPGHLAAARAAGEHFPRMREAVGRHLEQYVGADGDVRIDAEYLLVTARRR